MTTLQIVRTSQRTAPAMSEADKVRFAIATARPDAEFARRIAAAKARTGDAVVSLRVQVARMLERFAG